MRGAFTTTTAAIAALAACAMTMTTTCAQMTGSWSDVKVTEENSQTLLDALSGGDAGYAEAVGDTRVCFNDIKKVEQQVVAGMLYKFHIKGCKVSASKLAGECAAHQDAKCDKPAKFVVTVFEQVWTDTLQVKSIEEEKEDAAAAGASAVAQSTQAEAVAASVKASPDADADAEDDSTDDDNTEASMSDKEKRQVDQWIAENDLNQFGDSKHTMYTGGTPLFDESTGETIDRYDYILSKHPDRPWKSQVVRANLMAVADESARMSGTKGTAHGSASGLMTVIVSVGVLTLVLAMVAGVKAKRTRHRFAYDSLRNREY